MFVHSCLGVDKDTLKCGPLAQLKGENDFMIKRPFNECLSLYFKSDFMSINEGVH